MYSVAYLCCELKSRDLESRLLIATHLLNAGIAVVVGQVWALVGNAQNKKNLPGCYLFTTANDAQAKGMAWASEAGHLVAASDEEAFPLVDSLINVSPEAIERCHCLLVDSKDHLDRLKAASPEHSSKFRMTGSPRAEAIQTASLEPASTNPYFLFNTGFGLINSLWGDVNQALNVLRSATTISKEEALLRVKVEQYGLESFKALIRAIAPQYRVVVRPHPSERAQFWRDDFPEVEVVEGSASLPWIKGAKAVVHANSTTGLEAAMLGVPTINYDPIPEWGERFLMSKVNHSVRTPQEVASTLSALLSGDEIPSYRDAAYSHFPGSGARNTAEVIREMIGRALPLPSIFPWSPVERTEGQKAKLSVNVGEVKAILKGQDVHSSIYELDDSVFLLTPTEALP